MRLLRMLTGLAVIGAAALYFSGRQTPAPAGPRRVARRRTERSRPDAARKRGEHIETPSPRSVVDAGPGSAAGAQMGGTRGRFSRTPDDPDLSKDWSELDEYSAQR